MILFPNLAEETLNDCVKKISPFDAQYIPPPINQVSVMRPLKITWSYIPSNFQLEYVQLCKTLYTLLQDSPEEQELLQAMGRVANTLLKVGEDNVANKESTGQEIVFTSSAENIQTAKDYNKVSPGTDVDCVQQTPTQTEQCSSESDVKIDICETRGTTATDQLTQKCDEGTTAFDMAVADAAELEAKWFLSFEQFVAGVQQEPELCQFFAEQNVIDLSGSSVDPILSQYTRTILGAT